MYSNGNGQKKPNVPFQNERTVTVKVKKTYVLVEMTFLLTLFSLQYRE